MFSGKLRRYFSIQNFFDFFLVAIGFLQSFWILITFRPDVVFSKGGFVSVPLALVSHLFRVHIVVHESDSVPGLANRIVGKHASRILTSFPAERGDHVGTPIRAAVLAGDAAKGKSFLEFVDDQPIVFAFAGSQGSKRINDAFYDAFERIIPHANVVLVTGNKTHWSIDRPQVRIYPFLHEEYADILAAADLVVCRSGGSIFEVAAHGKPMLLIPHPHTGSDHQRKNAEIFVEHGAAEILLDADLTPNLLGDKIINLINHPKRREALSTQAKKMVRLNAAERIAKVVVEVGSNSSSEIGEVRWG